MRRSAIAWSRASFTAGLSVLTEMQSAAQPAKPRSTSSSPATKSTTGPPSSRATSRRSVKSSPGRRRSWCFRPSGNAITRAPRDPSCSKRTPSTVLIASAGARLASSGTAPRTASIAAKSAATSTSRTASAIVSPTLVTVIRSWSPDSTKRTRLMRSGPTSASNVADASSVVNAVGRGSTPLISSRSRERILVSPSHRPSPENSPTLIEPSRAETVKNRSRLSMTRSEMSRPAEINAAGSMPDGRLVRARHDGCFRRRFECGTGAERVRRPLVSRQQVGRHGLEVAHALVRADRLADGEDADRGVASLDDVAQHVEVRVVRDAGLADAPDCRAHRRLRPVDRLALAEVELVARAAPRGGLLGAELDPLRVVGPLADVDDEPHRTSAVIEVCVHPGVALALSRETVVAPDQQRRLGVELDPVDRRQERHDRERVRDEVGDHADVRRRADQRLLLEDLDPYLFDAVEEVAQRPLLGEQHREQADLELEVVVVGGDDLDAPRCGVEEAPVLVGRRAQRLLDEDDVAQLVVALERRQVGSRRRRDVGDHVGARLELTLELLASRRAMAVPVEEVAVRAHLLLLDADPVARPRRVLLDDVGAEVEELLQREQVLVRLLSPLAEPDEDEVLLQVALLLRERVQASVLDRHRRLHGERLRALHLLGLERTRASALDEHGGADRLLVGDERQGQQGAHAEHAHVRGIDAAPGGVLDDDRFAAVEA